MFLVIFDRLLLAVLLFDLLPFDHLSSDKLLYDNDIHKSFEIRVLGKVLRIIHKVCSISQLQSNLLQFVVIYRWLIPLDLFASLMLCSTLSQM